ncbi:MAG TPA: hypothetical protein VL944_00560 [Candidatus Acidoferrum sp.]|nr:hypothetical protein [Candidatus Acidoferrum sp.]
MTIEPQKMLRNPLEIRRALLSVYDKTGIVEIANAFLDQGAELISTGGTYRALASAGLPVLEVSQVTGAPEILDGRVKTLDPHIHGPILANKGNPGHMKTLSEQGMKPIDAVVGNLYPFEEAVRKPGATFADINENVDIGGPAMARAAAKNHDSVLVVPEPKYYPEIAKELRSEGSISYLTRLELAQATFARTAAYDTEISRAFAVEVTKLGGKVKSRSRPL